MNIAKMMKQAQQMQADMQKLQAEVATKTFEGTAGGGAVKATVNGNADLTAIVISPDLVKEGDTDIIQDLVVVAIQEAQKIARDEVQKEMGKITAGMGNIPGLGF
jgi:hypothetical protein